MKKESSNENQKKNGIYPSNEDGSARQNEDEEGRSRVLLLESMPMRLPVVIGGVCGDSRIEKWID